MTLLGQKGTVRVQLSHVSAYALSENHIENSFLIISRKIVFHFFRKRKNSQHKMLDITNPLTISTLTKAVNVISKLNEYWFRSRILKELSKPPFQSIITIPYPKRNLNRKTTFFLNFRKSNGTFKPGTGINRA